MINLMRKKAFNFFKAIKDFGLINGFIFLWNRRKILGKLIRGKTYLAPFGKERIAIRNGTSDIFVYRQIFIDNEYKPLTFIENVDWVIDCGANVGYSAFYFLNKFPNSRVVCIEPDVENYKVLCENLKSFSNRVIIENVAVWPVDERVYFTSEPYRDGREWARQICSENEKGSGPYVEGLSISSLLKKHCISKVSVMKIDIEGAEVPLFSKGDLIWLDKVMNFAIELHDDSFFGNATELFFSALKNQPFKFEKSGELIICKRFGQ
jgi:FkbM family methyltransferase